MEASTVDTANKKLTLLGIYKRDLGEAQRTIADIRGTIGMIEKENDRLRAQHDAMASELEREYRRRIVLESERDSYRNLAVMLGVIAAVETIALLVRWGIK